MPKWELQIARSVNVPFDGGIEKKFVQGVLLPSFQSARMDRKGFQENEYLRHSPLCMTLWNFFWQKKPKEGEHFLRYAADLSRGEGAEEGGREDVAKRRIH